MTAHFWSSKIAMAYAIAATYVLLMFGVVSYMCSVYFAEGELPLWLTVSVYAFSLAAWPLGKLTDKLIKH